MPGSRGRAFADRHTRSVTAFAASFTLHILLAIAAFGTLEGALVSEATSEATGDTPGQVVSVTLVRLERTQRHQDAGSAALKVLADRIRQDGAPVHVADEQGTSSFDRLALKLRQQNPLPIAQEPEHPRSQAYSSASVRPMLPGGAKKVSGNELDGVKNGGKSASGIWGQIAPCWQTPSLRTTVPVTLEVTLDHHGAISKPPRILRASAQASERQLAAEAAALAALAACLPPSSPGFANQVFRLDFLPG